VRELRDRRTGAPGCRVTRAGLWLGFGLWLCAAACGQEPAGPEQAPAGAAPAALPVAPANGRLVVAEVGGAPVYEDCVAAQAAARGIDRRAALDECIAFELLAQEAERRGLAEHPDVRRAQKTESVRRLIDEAFRARYPGPDSVPRSELEAIHRELRLRYVRPQYRETTFVRMPAPEEEHPAGSPVDVEARSVMEQVHAKLAGRRGLSKEDLQQAMADVAGERKVEHGDVHPIHRQDRIVEPYLAATFAIPEPGMVSPPFRTQWGWDIVLLVRIHEALDRSVDEVAGELFEILRRRLYQQWEASLRERAAIAIHEDTLARVQAADEQARFAGVPGAADGPAGGVPGQAPGAAGESAGERE
jgi:peptidyl-prolyl cis-trans isomerase C